MEIINNIEKLLGDDLKNTLKKGSKVSIAASCFSIYAYESLKKELEQIDELRFIFNSPTFIKDKIEKEQREFYIPKLNRERSLYGTEYEIKLKNELTQKAIAKECSNWIKEKITFKSNKTNAFLQGFMNIENGNEKITYIPIQGFTTVDLGFEKGNNLSNMVNKLDEYPFSKNYLDLFEQVWNDDDKMEDITAEVVEYISTVYKENSPEFIYFVILYNIFNEFLDDITEDLLPNESTGFKETEIWKRLYNFQKDAVIGTINKLQKYHGCILADSVGLGKTFTALGVIKYYELRNKNVLVLCPKKLSENWNTFRENYTNNILYKDRFNYNVLYHTDLSRDSGYTNGINLGRLNWGNYGLLVIDESHNFRNNDPVKDRETRYQRLMRKVIRTGVKTDVLMLSATPVNNRFNDLKNQLALAYEGNPSNINAKLNTKRGVDDNFNAYVSNQFTSYQEINNVDLDEDGWIDDEFSIGDKVKINLSDMDRISWREDLNRYRDIILYLLQQMGKVSPDYDQKLFTLKNIIREKINNPINKGNKKILIFTAFSDTADYLYEEISQYVMDKFNLHTAKVVGYDIHWNPVRITQRFGRIDRIGSKNDVIQLVNFWPNMSLDEYINLRERVENKMVIVDMTATGDDNYLSSKPTDLEYRKEQLKKLQDEVLDFEDINTGVSITDLGLNDFRMDLVSSVNKNGDLDKVPNGLHTVITADEEKGIYPGVIFALKNINDNIDINKQNALYPFYLVYVNYEGEVVVNHLKVKKILDVLRIGCKGKSKPIKEAYREFNRETRDGKKMDKYSKLLEAAIRSIINVNQETTNLELTKEVEEIQIFEIILKEKYISVEILENIDRVIPYPILYILRYNDDFKLAIAYKERNKTDENKMVVHSYYQSGWKKEDELEIDILKGITLKDVYDNIIRQLIPIESTMEDDIKELIELNEAQERLKKEISKLESSIKREKQFNKKVDLNIKLQKKRIRETKALEKLKN